ncbi:retrovirus-related pol polyprotein from transposon TNT 1-94 [Tanacetum coccineum]
MFDEYLEPPRVERPVSLAPAFGYSTFSKSFTVIFGITISMFTSSSEASSSGDVSSAESTHWIYKVKLDEYSDVLKNKARLVAKGYQQEKGIDFEESFATVARIEL